MVKFIVVDKHLGTISRHKRLERALRVAGRKPGRYIQLI